MLFRVTSALEPPYEPVEKLDIGGTVMQVLMQDPAILLSYCTASRV